ncbi:MAG TPA: sigma-70 family RNA polymerase sigma factor [Catenuloplanes sp.]
MRRDALLVVRAQLGDRRSLAELVGHWHDPVWRYVRRMLDGPGRADDVSQEVWAGALRALPKLREPERFAPWLFTIARRSVMDHLREKYSAAEPVGVEQVDDEVAAVLDRTQLAEGLADLPPREREVLILFYLHDLALEDCAQVLQIPPGTVKSRLSRARRLLRDRLVERGYSA